MGGRILWEVVVSKRFSSLSIDWKKRPLRRSCGLAEFLCYWRYNMISDTTTHTRKSLFTKKDGLKNRQVGEFHEVIRLPSVTIHLKIILRWKRFLQAENLAVFYYQRQSHDCGDHVVWLISICYWRYNVIFDTPRSPPAEKSFSLLLEIFNFAMLFFFLPNFD